MKVSQFKDYSELPLFLNAELVAKVLGVSPSSGYELMHESGFPILKIGNRMVVPRAILKINNSQRNRTSQRNRQQKHS